MTYSFVNLSTTRFTLNGNTFYKTFLPFYIDSTHIRVYNIYDSRLSLLDVTHVSDIEVDGTVFTNATELINAIHTVLFTKGGESGEEINNEQIELNRLAIIALQSSKADSTHTHDTRYYTKAQVDNLLSLIGSNQGIASGYVDGDKIRFYDSNGNQVLMVDADAFLAQGVSVLFEDGILYLKDSTGQILSTTPVKANEAYYDTYVYDSGFETGLSDLDPEYPFMIVKTNSDAYYFINDANNTEVLDGSRIYLNEPELFFELGVPDITTEGFKAWLLDITELDLIEDEEYRFNVWLTQGGIEVDTVLDAGSTNPVSNTAVTTAINLLTPHPVYIDPTASLTNATQTVEMGTSISGITLDISFIQNDAGEAYNYSLLRNGTEISIASDNTRSETNITGVITFQGVVYYSQGPVKQNVLGVNDPVGQIAPGSVSSSARTITPKYKVFFGAASAQLANATEARVLPSNGYADSSTINLVTGIVATKFYVVLPLSRVITQVNDVGNLNANITATYVELTDEFAMQDAGGNTYTARLYERTQAVPYNTSTNHLITLGNG